MNFEVNKIAGAVLGTLLLAMGSGFLSELIYEPKPAGKLGFDLPVPEPKAPGEGKAEAAKVDPIATRLAGADAAKGEAGTKACKGCHSFDKASANGIGPGLWDVVERPKGSHVGFGYSAAMKEKGGTWTYEDLDHFIEKPKGFIKDTKMVFPGIGSPQERANVIAYLRTLSDSPKPLPAAEKKEEAAKPAEAKPAEAKPAEAKPADAEKLAPAREPAAAAKPEDAGKPAGGEKPAEAAPSETKPDQPADTKPQEGAKPEEGDKAAADAPADTLPEGGKPAETDKPSADQAPPPEKPAERQ